MKFVIIIIIIIIMTVSQLLHCSQGAVARNNQFEPYRESVQKIMTAALSEGQDAGFERLAYMCDVFGPRLVGSDALESAMRWMRGSIDEQQLLSSSTLEPVTVTRWLPGSEHKATLTSSSGRVKHLNVLPLGNSIGAVDVRGEVIVVGDFDELERLAEAGKIRGKIVVYNQAWTGYSSTSAYRREGASRASEFGALASAVRSVTPYSLYTPHTGVQSYGDDVMPIPAIAVTVEDAELMARMQARGDTVTLSIALDCAPDGEATSHNVVADLRGAKLPDEVVLAGGHIDSWFVGSGAHDDGGAVVATWLALDLLAELGMAPARTLRMVGWTSEENGGAGANAYFERHRHELNRTMYAMEADGGIFTPVGLSFDGAADAQAMLADIAALLAPTLTLAVRSGGAGADVNVLAKNGVPSAGLLVEGHDDYYFRLHHTNADVISHVDRFEFKQNVGAIASLLYVIGDMEQTFPRK
jgi:carboxypeptidase Q